MMSVGEPRPDRVLIVGPGGVAGFLGVQLASAGVEVLFCARHAVSVYTVQSADRRFDASARIRCITDPVDLPQEWSSPAWVIVGVKTHQLESAGLWFDRMDASTATVVGLQNGVRSGQLLATSARAATVLPVLAYCGAETIAPGDIRHSGESLLVTVDTDAGRALKALFVGTALRIDMVADIVTAVWRKALVNSALNGVTALSRRRLDVLREDAVARLAHSLMLECWQVAVTYGAEIPHAEVEALARWLSAYASATGTTSMYQDWMADSPNEHEAIYGDVVRLGRTHGVDTPLHEAIDALLAAGAPERKAEPADGC